jgi:hypothetical protein
MRREVKILDDHGQRCDAALPDPDKRGALNRAKGPPGALLFLVLATLSAAAGCGGRSDVRVARRILEDHRRRARVKPLPAAQVLRLGLSPVSGREPAPGTGRIEWDGAAYRETVASASAGWTTVRGLQAGKAYCTDEDGVTRVASEPVLADLLTRSYFWRRAYLFDDLEGAKIALGPADEKTVSLDLSPRGGNALRLRFGRKGELLSAHSPRFDLEFQGPSRFTDLSRPDAPIRAEIRSSNLPSGTLADAQAGGWSARWAANPAAVPLLRAGGGIAVEGKLGAIPVRIALDASADGPVRIREEISRRAGLAPVDDLFGRRIARGRPLEVGALSYPQPFLEISSDIPEGCDARAGAIFFRETVVELDPAEGRVRFHEAERWSPPPGFFKGLLDDDGDRPVAILRRGGDSLRLRAGVPGTAGVVVAAGTARRLGLSHPVLTDFKWGTAALPPAALAVSEKGFDPEWGDDGALGFDPILKFHAFLDLPRRWAYLRPLGAPAASP